MEKEKFNAEKIRKVCEETGFDIMAFINLLASGSTSITFYADGSVTKLPERGREKIIGRIKFPLSSRSQTKEEQEQTKPDVIELGELMSPLRDEPTPKPRNLEHLPFKERFSDLSKAEVGDYVFANGVISKDPHAAKVLTGVIGWINPDPLAPIGKRALVITPETIRKVWSEDCYEFGCTDLDDGWQNTYKLLDQAKKEGKKLPAVEYCANYAKRGVRAGEGFLAAINQLKAINPNAKIINQALRKIGGDLWEGWMWSSSEIDSNYAWSLNTHTGDFNLHFKYNDYDWRVRCILAI